MPDLRTLRLFIFLTILFSDTGAQVTQTESVLSAVPDGTTLSENVTRIDSDKLNGHLESETLEVLPNGLEKPVEEGDAEGVSDTAVITRSSWSVENYGDENVSEGALSARPLIALDEEIATKDATDGFGRYGVMDGSSTSGDFLESEIAADQNERYSENYSYEDDVSTKTHESFFSQTTDGDIFSISSSQDENDKSLFEFNDPTDIDIFKHEETTMTSYNYNPELLKETEELLTRNSTESSYYVAPTDVNNMADYNSNEWQHRFTTIDTEDFKEHDSFGDRYSEDIFSEEENGKIGFIPNYETTATQFPILLDSTLPNFYDGVKVEYTHNTDLPITATVSSIQENDITKIIFNNFGSDISSNENYKTDEDSIESTSINANNAVPEINEAVLIPSYEEPTSQQPIPEVFQQVVPESPSIFSWLTAVEDSATEIDVTESSVINNHPSLISEKINNRRHNLTIIRAETLANGDKNLNDGISVSENDEIKEDSIEFSSVTENSGVDHTSETSTSNEYPSSTLEEINETLEKDNGNFYSGIPSTEDGEIKESFTESTSVPAVADNNIVTENDEMALTSTHEEPTLILERINVRNNLTIIRPETLEHGDQNFNGDVSNSDGDETKEDSIDTVAEVEKNGVELTSAYGEPTLQESTTEVSENDTSETNTNNKHPALHFKEFSERRHNLTIIRAETLKRNNESINGEISSSKNDKTNENFIGATSVPTVEVVTGNDIVVLTTTYEEPTSQQPPAEDFKQDLPENPTTLSWSTAADSAPENDTTEASINDEHPSSISEEINDDQNRDGAIETTSEFSITGDNGVTESDGDAPTHQTPSLILEKISARRHNLAIIRAETLEKNNENEITWNKSDSDNATETNDDENNETLEDVAQENTTPVDNLEGEEKSEEKNEAVGITPTEDATTSTDNEHSTEENGENNSTTITTYLAEAGEDVFDENGKIQQDNNLVHTTMKDLEGTSTEFYQENPSHSTEKEEIYSEETTMPILMENFTQHSTDNYEESTRKFPLTTKVDSDEVLNKKGNHTSGINEEKNTTTSDIQESDVSEDVSNISEELEVVSTTDRDNEPTLEEETTDSVEIILTSTEKFMPSIAIESKIYSDENHENDDNVEKSTESMLEEDKKNWNILSQIHLKETIETTSKRTETVIENDSTESIASNEQPISSSEFPRDNLVGESITDSYEETNIPYGANSTEEIDSVESTTLVMMTKEETTNYFTGIKTRKIEAVVSTTETDSELSTEVLSTEDFSEHTEDKIDGFSSIKARNKVDAVTTEQFEDSSEDYYSTISNENGESGSVESTSVPVNDEFTEETVSTTENDTELSTETVIDEEFSKITKHVIESIREVTIKDKVDVFTTERTSGSNRHNYSRSNERGEIDFVESTTLILTKEEIKNLRIVSIKDSTTEEIVSTVEIDSEISTEELSDDKFSKVTENVVESSTEVENKVDAVTTEELSVEITQPDLEAFTLHIAESDEYVNKETTTMNSIFSDEESTEVVTDNALSGAITVNTFNATDLVEQQHADIPTTAIVSKFNFGNDETSSTDEPDDDITFQAAKEKIYNDIDNAQSTEVVTDNALSGAITVNTLNVTDLVEQQHADIPTTAIVSKFNLGNDETPTTSSSTDAPDDDITFQAAKEKIYNDIDNATKILIKELTPTDETEATEPSSIVTVTDNIFGSSEEESLESEENTISSEERHEEINNGTNFFDKFLSSMFPARKTTASPTLISEQSTEDGVNVFEEDTSASYLNGNVFGNQANVTIEIEYKGTSFYIPSDAYLRQDLEKLILNITWRSHDKLLNNSLSFLLAENPKIYALKEVRLNLVRGNNLKVSSHVFASPERDLSETTSSSIVFKDGVRVSVSNFGFLKINEKEINSNDIESMTSEIKIDKKDAGIAAGCIGAALLVCAVLYVVITQARRRTVHIETLTKHDIP